MVNTTTRIQGPSKYLGTRILASEATVDGLDEILTRPVGSFLLAGKSAAVCVVEVVGRRQDANPRTSLLHQRFSEALQAYRACQWLDAARLFSEILDLFPDDGPSRFYLQRCQGYAVSPLVEPWHPTVRIDQK
jgi:adenylate cyclase